MSAYVEIEFDNSDGRFPTSEYYFCGPRDDPRGRKLTRANLEHANFRQAYVAAPTNDRVEEGRVSGRQEIDEQGRCHVCVGKCWIQ